MSGSTLKVATPKTDILGCGILKTGTLPFKGHLNGNSSYWMYSDNVTVATSQSLYIQLTFSKPPTGVTGVYYNFVDGASGGIINVPSIIVFIVAFIALLSTQSI